MSVVLSVCQQALALAEQRIQALEQELATARAVATTADQRLAMLSEYIPVGLLLYDDDNRIVLFNEQLREILLIPGTGQQWLGKTSEDILPILRERMQDPDAFMAWVQEVRTSYQHHFDTTMQLRDGRILHIDYISITANNEGSLRSRLLCLQDVTERQEVTYELAQQRAFYEHILDSLPAEIIVIDPDLRLRYVNSYAEPDSEKRADLLGKCPRDYAGWTNLAPTAITSLFKAHEQMQASGTPQTWEDTICQPDGHTRYVQRYLSQVNDNCCQTGMLIGFGADVTQRHLAEERTQALFKALPDSILVVDAAGRVRDAKVGDTALALPESSLKGRVLNQLLPPEALATLLPCIAEARRLQEPGTCTFELQAADGQPTYHTARLVVLADNHEVLISLLNTTPQELARQQLEEQQAFVRQVVDTSPTLIYVRDSAGEIIFKNRAFEKMTRYSKHVAVLKDRRQAEIADSDPVDQELAELNAHHASVMYAKQEHTYEISCTMTSGEVRSFQLVKRPLPRADGTTNVLTIATDITETKRARQKLELSQKKYRDLVNYSQGLICTHDLAGNILTVNPAVERCLDTPAAQLTVHNLSEIVLPTHHESLQEYLQAFANQQTQRNMLAIRTSSGEKRYLDCHNYLVHATDDMPAYVVVSAYDVTDGLRAEKALRQAKREVEMGARAKEEFLASMSHEIRTPLNGVLGMAGLLAKTALNQRQREFVDTIDRSGQHLLAVISDVLDMAKISAGLLQLEHASFNVCESVLGAVKPLTYLAESKGVYMAIECAPIKHPQVLGDAHRLNQVLLNLLSNAIKFTDRGSITVGSKVLTETASFITLRFWVRDTGIGIAPEQQQRIFDTFTQASPDTTRRYGGSGLGLAISHHLVQRMGGMLTVASKPGEGSTFSFTLTLPRASQELINSTPVAVDYRGLSGRRVLLAEDNRVNQRVATLMLENWGVTVDCASSGAEALAMIDERTYDLVLMDIQMPGMSGAEATTILRRHPDPRRANLPVVALTANAFRRDREQYLAAGMTACMTKPFQERRLYELLLGLLNKHTLPTSNPPDSESPPLPVADADTSAPTATTTAPAESTAYSLDFLTESANGNTQFVDRMVDIFLTETPVSTEALQTALVAQDWQTIAKVVHSVKPSLTLLQVHGLTPTFKALESKTTLPADRAVAAKFLIQQLQSVCQSMAANHGTGARLAG